VEAIADWPEHPVPFWEIAPENLLGQGGRKARRTREILRRDPVLTHGLSLSLAGFDPWDPGYLRDLAALLEALRAPFHSEHLCFTTVGGSNTHELLPMPFTRASAQQAIQRIRRLRSELGVPVIIENITYYAELGDAEMSDGDFLIEVLEGADCGLLLDVNNVYVNSLNWGFDPYRWLERMPLERVRQLHIAGHERFDAAVVDTHGAAVADPVADLMQWVIRRRGPLPVLLERDHGIPDLAALLEERERLQVLYAQALAEAPVHA
jgi:uncharacterized protein (UPF0276 family)